MVPGCDGCASTSVIRPLGRIGPTPVHFSSLNGDFASIAWCFANCCRRAVASGESLTAWGAALAAPAARREKTIRMATAQNHRRRLDDLMKYLSIAQQERPPVPPSMTGVRHDGPAAALRQAKPEHGDG